MILVDTARWIDYLRIGNECFRSLLQDYQVLCHPVMSGEWSYGNLYNRNEILHVLKHCWKVPWPIMPMSCISSNAHRLHGQDWSEQMRI